VIAGSKLDRLEWRAFALRLIIVDASEVGRYRYSSMLNSPGSLGDGELLVKMIEPLEDGSVCLWQVHLARDSRAQPAPLRNNELLSDKRLKTSLACLRWRQ